MSRRSRTLEILTAAGLADSDLARERMRGERAAHTTNAVMGALSSLAPAVGHVIGAGQSYATDDAATKAQALLAKNASIGLGSTEAPEVLAQQALEQDEGLKKTGNPLIDLFAVPAREKARAGALTGLTERAMKNRTDEAARAADARKAKLEQDKYEASRIDSSTKFDADELERRREQQRQNRKQYEAERHNREMERLRGTPKPADQAKAYERDLRTKILEKVLDEKSLPTEKTAESIAQIDEAIGALGGIVKAKEGIDTGKYAGGYQDLKVALGFGDTEWIRFKSDTIDQLNQYIHDMTGAAVGVEEAKRLIAAMPTSNDDDEAFLTKIESVYERLKRNRNAALRAANIRGRDTSQVPEVPALRGALPTALIDDVDWLFPQE